MKKWLLLIGVVAGLGVSASPAHAFGWGWAAGCFVQVGPSPCYGYGYWPGCYTSYQACPVTCYYPQWYEQKVPYTVPRWSWNEVVQPVRVVDYIPRYEDVKQQVVSYVPVPRTVAYDVPTCRWVPMVMIDPCTGCCYVSCRPELVMQRVQTVVCDYRTVVTDQVVKVCRWEARERVVQQRCYVPAVTYEQSWTVQRYCVMVPYTTTVNVPVWTGCYTAPNWCWPF